jgi:hypothetical protein
VCAVFEEIIDAVWNFGVVPAIEAQITQWLHGQVDQGVDLASSALEQNKPLQDKPIAKLIVDTMAQDVIVKNLDESLADIRAALDQYNSSAKALAQAAAAGI